MDSTLKNPNLSFPNSEENNGGDDDDDRGREKVDLLDGDEDEVVTLLLQSTPPPQPPAFSQLSNIMDEGENESEKKKSPTEVDKKPVEKMESPSFAPVKPTLEAKQIYIVMSKEYRISRNRRAEWFFNIVNTYIDFPPGDEGIVEEEVPKKKEDETDEDKSSTDFEVVSIIPANPEAKGWTFDKRHDFRYRVSPDTKIVYMSRRYRLVFCLDISPSVASVDVQAGGVVFDNIFKALQATLQGLLQPFEIPGSRRKFRPEIFLTVIAHTPFFTPVTDQVLIQGQILEKDTCANIIKHIFFRLNDIENRIALLITKRVQQLSSVVSCTNNDNGDPLAFSSSSPPTEYTHQQHQQQQQESSQHQLNKENDRRFSTGEDDHPNSHLTAYQEGEAPDEPATEDKPKRTTRRHPSNNPNKYSSFAMSPDFGLLDLLRQALIALSLMPENSSAGLVILTDGVISVPDGRYLDIILNQLRYNTVSCSFIQLSSPFHPHLCHGVLPYADLMKFIASATFGAFLSEAPEIFPGSSDSQMNIYHNAFLAWSFHKTLQTEWTKQRPTQVKKPGEWVVRNKCFFSVRDMPIVKKQQYENILNVDHMKVMSCRLREGFTIKEVVTSKETGLSEVTLILPWKFLIHLEYKIYMNLVDGLNGGDYVGIYNDTSVPVDESGYPSKVRCVVSLEGPYDFLHDVTCLAKKPFSSLYRQLMVNRFWATRKNLSESDRLLVHLNSFSSNPAYYNIPESLKNGMPLFYWGSATSSAVPQLHSNEQSYPQFTHFWKPVCLLDTTVWQKWMHTHRIGVILEHDYPLPKNLHLPNSTGRFNVIQCRQAVMALNTLLKKMSSFVLLENQSYVRLMFKNDEVDKAPHSFCLIRVTSKPPHVVLRLAFLVGTPGHLRHRTVALFREKIATLTFPQRVKDPPKWRVIITTPVAAKAATTASPLVNKTSWSDMPCCLLVHKPVEKILIRYDKAPDDFRRRLLSLEETSSMFQVPESKAAHKQSTFGFRPTYQTAPVTVGTNVSASIQMLPEVFNTIARYLHHRRWIWWFPSGADDLPPLNVKWASEILATVTKTRLQEGFRFAYSSSGITNMVLELPMKNEASSEKNSVAPMVLQFLVFPPTSNLKTDFEDLDSSDGSTANSSLYLVTECWVEPQCGYVTEDTGGSSDTEDLPVIAKSFLDLEYTAIPKLLFETDQKCISLVGTFEYLVRICSHKDTPFSISVNQPSSDAPCIEENETIEVVPFEFDLKQILKRSGQVEILFSSFFQDLSLTFPTEWNLAVCSFFERSNAVLYQQWCYNISMFQDKEVALSQDQHEVATRAVLQRKGLDDLLDPATKPSGGKGGGIQWRCFVRSRSSTHVLLTLIPATLKDMKNLVLHLDQNVETIHKTRSSQYVDFLDVEYNVVGVNDAWVMECPNQAGRNNKEPRQSYLASSSSPQLVDHHQLNCRNCQAATATIAHSGGSGGGASGSNRKRVRAFSGGSECAPAIKKYLTTATTVTLSSTTGSSNHSGDDGGGAGGGPEGGSSSEECKETQEGHEEMTTTANADEDEQKVAGGRSQTFSEGTVSGKLAHFMRAKRTLSDQSGGTGDQQEQDNLCADPQRCGQLYDYLNRCGGPGGMGIDDSLRYVPCRPPVVGSLALCVFTYSCSLMSLTDHVVFKKLSKDELKKDFRVIREGVRGRLGGLGVYMDDYDPDGGDDDDDISSGSGSLFPNGRSISQESFSESSLQRLEEAGHEMLLRSHCVQMKEAHLQAYIWSAYRSLLSGYQMNSCDIRVVIDKCILARVRFPLNKFLQFVCRHKKSVSKLLENFNEGGDGNDSQEESDEKSEVKESKVDEKDDSAKNTPCVDCCGELASIHQFIKKRFRRLISRNFTPCTENGHILFYKLAGSNALSDFSAFGGGAMVKCSSDLEDNIDSCSIAADSLCSGDDHYPPHNSSSHNITSDHEITGGGDRGSVAPSHSHRGDHRSGLGEGGGNTAGGGTDDVHSYSGYTQASLLGSSAVPLNAQSQQCAPLFCYLNCGFQVVQEEDEEESRQGEEGDVTEDDEEENTGYIPLMDIPTCYHDLCLSYLRTVADGDDIEDELDLTPRTQFQLSMELTFLTAPEPKQTSEHKQKVASPQPPSSTSAASPPDASGGGGSSGSKKCGDKTAEMTLQDFQKRITIRQANALDHVIRDIHWLMEDEIISFRGGGGGPGSGNKMMDKVDIPLLEQVSNHVLNSLDKMGCIHQQIKLSFVEHDDSKGFHSFLERFNNLEVNEYRFKQIGMWWYLVAETTPTRSCVEDGDEMDESQNYQSSSILPPFWIILKAHPPSVLDLYHHCRYDENDLATLQFSRNLRVRIIDVITNLIRTINQDLLLQQLHDTRICSSLLESEDPQDMDEVSSLDMMMMQPPVTTAAASVSISKFGDSESDISMLPPMSVVGSGGGMGFVSGMFSCQVVWVTTFTLHSRLRSGGGKTAFARGIQTLRSTLTAFEVGNRKNMFVYRDASGNVFYMRFYRGVDVLESNSSGSPSRLPLADGSLGGMGSGTGGGMDDFAESELHSVAGSEASSSVAALNRIMIKRNRNQDSESEKQRDDPCDGILALKVHGIVQAGEEIKEKLVQSLRNKLDDAVLDILSVTLKRNPHCKLTPDDVHFLQEPRSRPDSVFKFRLPKFIVSGHLPAFSYYLHQNLLQFLSTPKYTSVKAKYHFQDYSRLEQGCEEVGGAGETGVGLGGGGDSSVYLYNQSPGGGGTGNRGIAIVAMALTDKLGNLIRNPEWKQPEIGSKCELEKFGKMIETCEVVDTGSEEGPSNNGGGGVMVEFCMWKQGRINLDLLKGHVDQAIKQAGWDLIMEFKLMTAPLSVLNAIAPTADDEGVFTDLDSEASSEKSKTVVVEKRRRSSHINPGTIRSNSTGGPLEDDDEPRTRSMSFTGLRKTAGEGDGGDNTDGRGERSGGGGGIVRDRAPSPVTLVSGARGAASEGSRPRVLLSRTQSSIQMSLSSAEVGEVGNLHGNYTSLLDTWLESGNSIGAPSLRRICVPLNCRYPVPCIVQELEKIINQVAPDNTPRQFWKQGGDSEDYVSYCSSNSGAAVGVVGLGSGGVPGGSVASSNTIGGRRDSGGDKGGGGAPCYYGGEEISQNNTEYSTLKRREKELLALEHTEEAEYPVKILNLFRKNENFQPSYKGPVCYLIARNLAHWKCCMSGDVDFSLHTSQDFKNFYKYPPLINDTVDIDGSRGSIEKLPRASNFSRGEFVLWSGGKNNGRGASSNIPILIPRQRFLRAKVTGSQVDFIVYNWSKECCERLQEHVTFLSHWIQARASLLSSLLLQKSGIFYCQPILPDNFGAGETENNNPFIVGGGGGDVADIKDLIMNTPPTGKHERRSHHHHAHQHHHHSVGMSGGPGAMSRLMSKLGMNVPGGPGVGGTVPSMIVMTNAANPNPVGNKTPWKDFYRNMSLCQVLGMPEPVGDNPVDAHGKQLYHVINLQGNNKEPENNAFFQYWLTRGPSASNVITTQVLESFTQTARTIHFCLTPVMFLPSWRQAVAQTRDSSSFGGIVRRHRASSTRRYMSAVSQGYGGHGQLHAPQATKLNLPPTSSSAAASAALIQAQRTRHGSEASQASSLASLRNRSKSYHSGMVNLLLHPEVISEKDFETGGGGASLSASPLQQQQQNLLLKVRSDEPWHGVLCRTFLQEYMQYLQTLGFVPVHRKASPSTGSGSGGGGVTSSTAGGGGVGGSPGAVPGSHLKRGVPPGGTNRPGHISRDAQKSNKQGTVPGTSTGGVPGIPGGGGGPGTPSASGDSNLDEDEDEKMIHFLQRCLPGGIIVIEVGLVPPFFYCKIHALEAKRIFPSKKTNTFNCSSVAQKNALQFVDECEKMKVLTHLHSFMYDFHLRAMYLYISGRQLLFKTGYHITTFLDDFITYYPKWPNFSRNAVHIGVVTLEDVVTPSQVLFNYITSHDKYYRMKVIRMTPLGASGGAAEDATSSSEYVLVHNMSRKVSYRSSDRGQGGSSGGGEDQQVPETSSGQQNLDEFDLTLVIAHDYPSANRAFVPNFQGLRVKYYIVLTSRRELYPKGGDLSTEPNTGKLCPVTTPLPLCSRHHPNCPLSSSCGGVGGMVGAGTSGGSGVGIFNKYVSPPAPPPSYFDSFEGHHHFHHPPALQHHTSMVNHHPQRNRQLNNNPFVSPAAYHNPYQNHQYQPPYQFPEMIREEKVRYMGYFSSHEQLMQKMIDEQKDTMEQFIRQLITKAAVDCRRELLWQRLLYGRPSPDIKIGKGNSRSSKVTSFSSAASSSSSTSNTNLLKEDIISRETVGPLSYQDFNELLGLVQVVPLNKVDPRVEELLAQPVTFYQTLIKVLMASIVVTHQQQPLAAPTSPLYSYREFVSMDQKIHQLAIFTPDAHKAIVMVEVNMDQAKCDIYVVVKENKKGDQQSGGSSGGGGGVPSIGDLGEGMYSLVEKVVNACCYATWTTLI